MRVCWHCQPLWAQRAPLCPWGHRQWLSPEAACLSGWALLLSFPVTSPRPSSSVCSVWRRLGFFPEISASSHPGLHPPPFSGDLQLAAVAVSSVWAASAALLAKPGGEEEVWQGGVRGESYTGGCWNGKGNLRHSSFPWQGLQQVLVERLHQMPLKLAAGKSLLWSKGRIFFLNNPLNISRKIFSPIQLVIKKVHLGIFSATTYFKPEIQVSLSSCFNQSKGLQWPYFCLSPVFFQLPPKF